MSNDLTGKKIQESYTRVLHTDGNKIYDGTGSVVLESTELNSLQTMNNNTVSNADWAYVASMDQDVNQSANPIFQSVRVSSNYDFRDGESNIEGINYSNNRIQFSNPINVAAEVSSSELIINGIRAVEKVSAILAYGYDSNQTDFTYGLNNSATHQFYGNKLSLYQCLLSSSATTGENILGTDLTVYGRIRTRGSEVSLYTGSIYASSDITTPSITTTDLIATGKVKIKGSEITLENGHISASGDMRATGSIYALTGSFGTGTTTITDSISTTGGITAVGAITAASLDASGAIEGGTVRADEIAARSGKTEITLGRESARITAILNGDLRIKGSDMFIGSGSISCSGEIHTTGSIVSGGDITAGDNCTGSFDHIVTLNNTIEFRDENEKSTVKGYLKFDDTYGLQALGSNQAQMLIQANKLKTARNIGGVSFNGTADINLPGVNTAGNQNTSGNAATSTKLAATKTIGGVAFDGSKNIIPISHLGRNDSIAVFPTDFFSTRLIQYSVSNSGATLKLADTLDSGAAYYNMQIPLGTTLKYIIPCGTEKATISIREVDSCGSFGLLKPITFINGQTSTTAAPCSCPLKSIWTVNSKVKNNSYIQAASNYLLIAIEFNGSKAEFGSLIVGYE